MQYMKMPNLERNWEPVRLSDIFLFFCCCLQLLWLIIGCVCTSDATNYLLHINTYVIIFAIIANLALRGISEHYLALLFFACFFIFLMGQKLFKPDDNVFLTFTRTTLNTAEYYLFLTIFSITEIFTYYAYIIFRARPKHAQHSLLYMNSYKLLMLVRMLFYVTLPFALYMQLKIVLVKQAMTYTGGYLINVPIPTLVKVAYYIFAAVSMVYLALKPRKWEMLFVLATLMVIEGGLQLFQGRRALVAATMFFSIWYLLKYYHVKRIPRWLIAFGVVGLLLVIIMFYFVEQRRGGGDMSSASLLYIIERLMRSTGGSDSVLANTIQRSQFFPKSGVAYLLDSIINNPVSIILTGKGSINQGMDYLANFDSFQHWLSYLTEPSLYLAGYGMGSCYVAEVYVAFGLLGVFGIALVLGALIARMDKISLSDGPMKNAVFFVLIRSLFTLPRGGLFSWFSDFTYLIVAVCLIYGVYVCADLLAGNERLCQRLGLT